MPWPKGKPRSPEVHARMLEGSRRKRAGLSQEDKDASRQRRSAAMRRAWERKSQDARNVWAVRCAESLARARGVAAEKNKDVTAHLTEEQRAVYRDMRGKGFRHSEAISLAVTGRMS